MLFQIKLKFKCVVSDLQGWRAMLSSERFNIRGLEGNFTAWRLQAVMKVCRGFLAEGNVTVGDMAEDQRQLKCSHRRQEDFSCLQSLWQGYKYDLHIPVLPVLSCLPDSVSSLSAALHHLTECHVFAETKKQQKTPTGVNLKINIWMHFIIYFLAL